MRIMLGVFCIIGVISAEFNVTINGYFYVVSYPLKLNWFQSFRHCRYINMYLIDLSTNDEIHRTAEVIKLFKTQNPGTTTNSQSSNFWTSGCALGDFTNFYWMSSGQPFGVSNWAKEQPDNLFRLEHCVEMQHTRPFRWNDEFCNYKKNFICRNRVVLPVKKSRRMHESRSAIPDVEKPVRVANATKGYTRVSLI